MSKNNTYCISKRKKKKKEKIVTRMKYGKVCDSLQHNNSAFTLIELSIVLIIIGLLIAGITSGTALIKSARIRSLANELTGYQRAIYSFYSLRNRLPGDINRKGVMGAEAFEGTVKIPGFDDFEPNASQAPLVELYVEELIGTKPVEGSLPKSKAFSNLSYSFDGRYITLSGNITKDVAEALDRILDNGETENGRIIYVENCEGGVADGGNVSDLPPAYDGAEFNDVACLVKEAVIEDKGACSGNYECSYNSYCPLDANVGCETPDYGQNYYCATTKRIPTGISEAIPCVHLNEHTSYWGETYPAGSDCTIANGLDNSDCYCPNDSNLKCVLGDDHDFSDMEIYGILGCYLYCPTYTEEPNGIPSNTFCRAREIILQKDQECSGVEIDADAFVGQCYCPTNSKIACVKDVSSDGCGNYYFAYKCTTGDENKKEPSGEENDNNNGLCSKITYDIGF